MEKKNIDVIPIGTEVWVAMPVGPLREYSVVKVTVFRIIIETDKILYVVGNDAFTESQLHHTPEEAIEALKKFYQAEAEYRIKKLIENLNKPKDGEKVCL